ncbi:MAG: hypothetical protein Q8R29_02310 [bacterium]|nr:hypothetical protein [bacterium]
MAKTKKSRARLSLEETIVAQERLEIDRLERRRIEAVKNLALLKEMKKRARSYLFPKCLKEIDEAVAQGKKDTVIHCGSYEGNGPVPKRDSFYVCEAVRLLEKESYKATFKTSYDPRCGSNDDYGNQTHLKIEISW